VFRTLWGSSHPDLTPTPLPIAQVASSIRFGDRFVMKLLANIEAGIYPGIEMGQVLTSHVAPLAGFIEYQSKAGDKTVLAMLHGFVLNQGNAWDKTIKELQAFFERMAGQDLHLPELASATPGNVFDLSYALNEPTPVIQELIGSHLDFALRIGQRLAQLHLKLASIENDPAFAPEPFNDFYRQGLYHGFIGLTGRRLEFLRQRYAAMEPSLREQAEKVLNRQPGILQKLSAIFEQRVPSQRTRFHGRAHLGHVLVADDDAVLFDLDGDPAQHISERRIKRCPIRDMASMVISFAYAVQVAVLSRAPSDLHRTWGRFWFMQVCAACLRGYWQTAKEASFMPKSLAHQQVLLDAYLMERALLDIRADMEARQEFAGVPFRVILHLLDSHE
jgi:maltose alpha-D-glucosyltransferase/alpha-amylase